tara:strand:- start:4992 stop:5477 length:486 start_codon:yes stop_codon:yes gene_type:complete
MATAIPELIASVLQTRLQQITVANGYEVTVSEVVRPTRESDIQPKDNQIIFSLAELTRTTELDCQGNPPAYAWTQSYNINAVLRPSEKSLTPSATLQNTIMADMTKAITAGAAWWKMGGNAMNTIFASSDTYDATDGSSAGVRIVLQVVFRAAANNPYDPR